MTENKMLIGSLSNDLNRVANLSYRGSEKAAQRFWDESKKWIGELKNQQNKKYINKIIEDLESQELNIEDKAQTENNLMYSILLQNYSLQME